MVAMTMLSGVPQEARGVTFSLCTLADVNDAMLAAVEISVIKHM